MSLKDYAVMPYSDYVGACEAIREKDGSSDPIKSGELRSKILGIEGGCVGTTGTFTLTSNQQSVTISGLNFVPKIVRIAVPSITYPTTGYVLTRGSFYFDLSFLQDSSALISQLSSEYAYVNSSKVETVHSGSRFAVTATDDGFTIAGSSSSYLLGKTNVYHYVAIG